MPNRPGLFRRAWDWTNHLSTAFWVGGIVAPIVCAVVTWLVASQIVAIVVTTGSAYFLGWWVTRHIQQRRSEGWPPWLGASPGIEKAMKAGRIQGSVAKVDSEGRIELSFLIFNGNSRSVRLTAVKAKPLLYGDDRTINDAWTVVELGAEIAPFGEGFITISIRMVGDVGSVMLADFTNGELKPIDLQGLGIYATDGKRRGRVETPDGAILKRHADYWTCGQVVQVRFGDSLKVRDS